MGLAKEGADVKIGPYFYPLDRDARDIISRDPYRQWSRSLFSNTSKIAGKPGAENINPDQLLWHWTTFSGEGQVVLDANDDFLAERFYRSEGLNFRVPGQVSLNPSTVLQSPLDSSGGATTTIQGNAFTNVTGTFTTVNTTDARLNVELDEIQSTVHTPGASTVQVDFYLYEEGLQYTTIAGSALVNDRGAGAVSGSDFVLKRADSACKTAAISSLSAKPYEVNWYAYLSASNSVDVYANYKVVDVTDNNNHKVVYNSGPQTLGGTSAGVIAHTHTFKAVSGKTYRFYSAFLQVGGTANMIVDQITYALATDPDDSVRVSVFNSTAAAEVSGSPKTVNVYNTASANIVSLVFTAVAATDYKYRIRYADGDQRPIVDKVITTVQSTSNWTLDAIELGQGGSVWLAGHRAATDSQTWTYNFSTNAWTARNAITGASNRTILALAHTDQFEYLLCSDNIVYQNTTAASNDYTAAMSGSATAVGMCIAQDRLMVLCEDATNGVTVRTFAVDADVSAGVTAQLASATVSTAKNTADTDMRQRMVATPTGGRFFVNYSDVTCKIYECDASATTPVVTEIAELTTGIKASSLTYAGGLTFIAGQFLAETGFNPVSALWVLDQNGVIQRVGRFRRDAPDIRAPQYMTVYQEDVWILQGNLVWRYSLITGGLFLEHELAPKTPGNQRSLAVVQGHNFALYSDEGIFVTGSVGTYRQSGDNSMTSSVYDFGLPGVRKVLDRLDLLTDTLSANVDVRLEAQVDQSGTFVPLGTITSGSANRLTVSGGATTTSFSNLQLRATLTSLTGVNTPIVKAIVTRAFPAEYEQFIDLVLYCADEHSAKHIDGQDADGATLARNLKSLWASGAYTTFTDGFEGEPDDDHPEYTVRIESFEQQWIQPGEGRVLVSLRVI